MRRLAPAVVLLLMASLAYWGYGRFFPSDETVIRKLLAEAAKAGSISGNDAGVAKFVSVKRLMDMCTEDILLTVEATGMRGFSVRGKEQLGEALAGSRAVTRSLSIEILDLGVEVEESRTTAAAQFVARVRVDGREEIVQEFRIALKRVEGEWKFAKIEPLQSLSM